MSLVVHLMGTVRLHRDGRSVDVGGPKQQAVLAVLALSAGHRVSTDRLVDLVWDENPPVSARRTIQSYVASLRRMLSDAAALESSQNGYTLDVDRGVVDLLAFEDRAEDLLADGDLDPDAKARGLADVLSIWETPLDGLRTKSRLEELTAPFEELRFQVVTGLAAAQIAGTRAGDAVRMLEALVREYPTGENLWLELARGLNRLGRSASRSTPSSGRVRRCASTSVFIRPLSCPPSRWISSPTTRFLPPATTATTPDPAQVLRIHRSRQRSSLDQ